MNQQILIGISLSVIIFTVVYFMIFSKSENLKMHHSIPPFVEGNINSATAEDILTTVPKTNIDITYSKVNAPEENSSALDQTLLAFDTVDGHVNTDYKVKDLYEVANELFNYNDLNRTLHIRAAANEDIIYAHDKISAVKTGMSNISNTFVTKKWMDENVVKRGGKYKLESLNYTPSGLYSGTKWLAADIGGISASPNHNTYPLGSINIAAGSYDHSALNNVSKQMGYGEIKEGLYFADNKNEAAEFVIEDGAAAYGAARLPDNNIQYYQQARGAGGGFFSVPNRTPALIDNAIKVTDQVAPIEI